MFTVHTFSADYKITGTHKVEAKSAHLAILTVLNATPTAYAARCNGEVLFN
jgi:hypothetical protein